MLHTAAEQFTDVFLLNENSEESSQYIRQLSD